MRFVTYRRGTDVRAGVLDDTDRIHPFGPGERLVDLVGERGRLHAYGADALAREKAVVDLGGVHLMAPVPNPPTIRDFMTFESHFE